MAADGSFVIAWQSYLQDGSGYGVYAQRFDSAGKPVADEFRVNTYTQNDQGMHEIAMAPLPAPVNKASLLQISNKLSDLWRHRERLAFRIRTRREPLIAEPQI